MKQPNPAARAEIQTKAIKANPDPSLPTAAAACNAHADGYCSKCSKIAWGSREKAEKEALKIKAWSDFKKPHLIHAYTCPHGNAFHVGHNFKLLGRQS